MLEFLHVLTSSCYVFTCGIMFKIQCACWKNFVFCLLKFSLMCNFIYWFKMKKIHLIQRLCKMSHDNPMMIGFARDEMTLKKILILCDPIITINTLISCIIGLEEKLQSSITSTAIGVAFSTNAKLCCCTNSLSMKHVDGPELRNAWVRIVMDLPPLIMMGNKKQGMIVLNS